MTTTLNCLGWMQNQRDQDPCTTAQEVGQLCSANYTVSPTNFQESSYSPNATTTNGCTCSWAIYNLLSACSYCVGQYQYTSWTAWIADCGSNASSTSYLPSGLRISQGIPFWAATNPSTWANQVFNVTQAADIAAAAHPDVTGGPLPTSTPTPAATTSSKSSTPIGAIVGSVLGAVAILLIGGLIILWAMRRRRRQRTGTTPADISSFNDSRPVAVAAPSNHTDGPSSFGYTYGPSGSVSPHLTSPVHSTSSLAAAPPVVSGILPHGAPLHIADAADMISPFLAMSSAPQTNRSNAPIPRGKVAEALSERTMAPPAQRVRLNPPPYSESEPGSASTGPQRASTKKYKKRNDSVSGTTTCSGHSRTSTRESVTVVHARAGSQSRLPAATLGMRAEENVGSARGFGGDDGGVCVEMGDGGRAGVSDERPPMI